MRRRQYSVVLFDEVEKANSEVFDILRQVLDDGRLTDGLGRPVDCMNPILSMTAIRKHYDRVSEEIAAPEGPSDDSIKPSSVHSIVLVSKLHRPTRLQEHDPDHDVEPRLAVPGQPRPG